MFKNEVTSNPVNRCLTLEELPLWLAAQPKIQAEFFIWHHTLSPAESQWNDGSLLGCFKYFRDVRKFNWGEGPQFWSAPGGKIWIGHHPSVPNYVGATNWNDYGSRQVMHMETVHNGDVGPYTNAYLMQHARACVIICRWAGIPIKWVDIGRDGGALKTWSGIGFHNQCYINGASPKTCPGNYVTQKDVWTAIQQANEEDDMTAEEIRTIVKDEIALAIKQVYRVNPDTKILITEEAAQYLTDQEVINGKHDSSKAASIGYVNVLLSRMLKKVCPDPMMKSPVK